MLARRLTLAAGPSPVADQVQAFMTEAVGRPVGRLGYDECRRRLAWDRPGVLVLVAADETDRESLAGLAREAAVRRSPVSIVAVHPTDCGDVGELADLSVTCLPWPYGSEALADAVRAAPAETARSARDSFADRLAALTPSLVPLAARLATAAQHDLTVLLTGETGTGKTFLAQLLHDHSPRRKHAFLNVPCGAQSSTLFASCFFGHVKGAFTSAHQAQQGKFAAAGKGTILLDEIDTLGLDQQASLLRVIETGEYEQVGGHVTHRSEARVIVASNCDLEEAVEQGRLRQDLFYRINVLSFYLPPLRRRPQDVGPLARSFAAHFAARFGRPLTGLSTGAIEALEAFDWPGNIRQLENTMQQAVLAGSGPELTADDLPEAVRRPSRVAVGAIQAASAIDPDPVQSRPAVRVAGPAKTSASLIQSRADYERHLVWRALEECNFNRSSAAKALGVSRVTLHKKIKQYGLAARP